MKSPFLFRKRSGCNGSDVNDGKNTFTILIDADGVMEDLTQQWVKLINERHGTGLSYEDVKCWDMTRVFPTVSPEDIHAAELSEELYDRLTPIPDAPYYIKKLMEDGHCVFVVSNTPYSVVKIKTEKVFRKYYPFIPEQNYIFTSRKQMIRGDILIDDGIHNLIDGDYYKFLFTAPYNADYDAEANEMIRVDNWKLIYELIGFMSVLPQGRKKHT